MSDLSARAVSVLGLAVMIGIAWIASSDRRRFPWHTVAIGGIDLSNASEVVAAGAAGVAVISAVANADDPVAATRALTRLLGKPLGNARGPESRRLRTPA